MYNNNDMRVSLPEGYTFITKENSDEGNSYTIQIEREIARGGSCIVYKGEILNKEDIANPYVIVKEFYPEGLDDNIERLENGNLAIAEEVQENFKNRLSVFLKGIDKHIIFYNDNPGETLQPSAYRGEANNTFYSMSFRNDGCTLSDCDWREKELTVALGIALDMVNVIAKLHTRKKMFLDCKPNNIWCHKNNVYLFDFDTVHSVGTEFEFFSYSEGWAAPEQLKCKNNIREYADLIGYHTDIYSIGAVIFYILVGRNPSEEDLKNIKYGFDWKNNVVLKDTTKALDNNLFLNTLNRCIRDWTQSVEARKTIYRDKESILTVSDDLRQLIILANEAPERFRNKNIDEKLDKTLEEIKEILQPQNSRQKSLPTSNNRFKYNSNSTFFRGRENEIRILTNMCNDSALFSWIGICGEGGTGKSRLAYELCSIMVEQGWDVRSPLLFDEYGKNDVNELIKTTQNNLLICLDYVKQEKDGITSFMRNIVNNLRADSNKIRIILIEREEKDVQIEENSEVESYKYTKNNGEEFDGIVRLKTMPEAVIENIVKDYILKQKPDATITKEDLDLILNTLGSVDFYHKRPLYALFIADAWINNEKNLRQWDRNGALRYLLERENRRLSAIIKSPQKRLNDIQQENYLSAVNYLYALATFLGSINISNYSEIIENKFKMSEDDPMLRKILSEFEILDSDEISGLVPDLIGEFYCINYLNKIYTTDGIERAREFVDLVIDRNLSAFIRYTDMIYKDFYDLLCESKWKDVLTNIKYPEKYSFVRKNLFNGCSFLRNITFTGRINAIQFGAFRDCENLEKIVLPSSLETIEKYAFKGCKSLVSVLPEDSRGKNPSVITVGDFAFQNCTALKDIILPESIQEIGTSAFENCISLEKIDIPRKIARLSNSLFAGCKELVNVNIQSRHNNKNEKDKQNTIVLADSCFFGCEKLEKIKGSTGIYVIERNAFKNCISLKTLSLSEKLVEIKDSAFWGCSSLTVVDLSKSRMSSISESLFYNCYSLEEVILPEKINKIADRSFFGCKNLKTFPFAGGLKSIGKYAFYGCASIDSVNIQKTVRMIGSHAFENCANLSKVVFDGKPRTIESHVFAGCSKLKFSCISGLDEKEGPVNFSGFTFTTITNNEFEFLQTYMTIENVKVPNTVCAISNDAFRGPKDESGFSKNDVIKSVVIPSSVTSIGERAFQGCISLEYVRCEGDTITHIGSSAFAGCSSLKTIEGKFNIEEISNNTFRNCTSLVRVDISGRLSKIGKYAFMGCKNLREIRSKWMPTTIETAALNECDQLKYPISIALIKRLKLNPTTFSLEGFVFKRIGDKELNFVRHYSEMECISLPETCIDISNVPFSTLKGLREIIIPDTIKKLPNGIFKGCSSLETVELPRDLQTIPNNLFENCVALKTIIFRGHNPNVIPEGVKIGKAAFIGCSSLNKISLPESLTVIEKRTFYGCRSLKDVNIPSNIRTIGNFAFKYCSCLNSINLPNSVMKIDCGAFACCTSLTNVFNLENTQLECISSNMFESCINLQTLALPEVLKKIEDHAFENCHKLIVERNFIPAGVIEMKQAVFQGCHRLKIIRIPTGVTEINKYTFKNCGDLENVIIHSGVTLIDDDAFYHCNSLLSVRLPTQLQKLGIRAFAYCNALKKVDIPDTVKKLSLELFRGCSSLEEVSVPNHINIIPIDCFKDCSALREINFPDRLKTIGAGAFRNCYSLDKSNLTFPEHLRDLQESAFQCCDRIVTVELPKGIAEIKATTFEGCRNLSEVRFEHHINDVGNYAFSDCTKLKHFPFDLVDNEIGDAAFLNCKSLSSPIFSDAIKKIKSAAFRGCSSIETLIFPASIEKIYGASFRDNCSLRMVVIPKTVTEIYKSAFRDCAYLSDVQIKSETITIHPNVFSGCINLDYVELPPKNTIKPSAFEDCPAEIDIRKS